MVESQDKSERLPFFLRGRGIAVDVLIAAGFCSGPPWWFEKLLGLHFTAEQTELLMVVALIVLAAVIVVSLHVRQKLLYAREEARDLRRKLDALNGGPPFVSRASLNMANRFRGIIQNCADRARRIKTDDDTYDFVSGICDSVASVFQEEMNDQAIDCSIRLASPVGVRYVTVGRSIRLNVDRRKHTEPVTAKSFIYRELTAEHATVNDVVLINNVDEAIAEQRLSPDSNMSNYGKEIRSMMVARLNVLRSRDAGEVEDLWGIIYVSSPKEARFTPRETDRLKELVPLVSATLWQVSAKRLELGEADENARQVQSTSRKGKRRSGGNRRKRS